MKLTINSIEIDATNGLDIRAELAPGVDEEMGPVTIVVSGARLFVRPRGTGITDCSVTITAEDGGCLALGGGRVIVTDVHPSANHFHGGAWPVDNCDAPVIADCVPTPKEKDQE